MNCKKFVSGAYCYMFLSLYLPSSSWTLFLSTTMREVISCIHDFQTCWLGWEKCRRGYLIFKEHTNPEILQAPKSGMVSVTNPTRSIRSAGRSQSGYLWNRGQRGWGPLFCTLLFMAIVVLCALYGAYLFAKYVGVTVAFQRNSCRFLKSWSRDLNCTLKFQFEVSFVFNNLHSIFQYLEEPWCLFKISWFFCQMSISDIVYLMV